MSDSLVERLTVVAGRDRVSTDAKVLASYSKDQSFVRPCLPDYVVHVENVREVEDVLKAANDTKTPVVPVSSGMNLRGAAIPKEGGIVLDLSRMNKIGQVNEHEGWVVIEPGVTYGQLAQELEKYKLRVMMPLGVPSSRSVITSIFEGDPSLASASFEYGNSLFLDTEIVLPEGWTWRVGKWRNRISGEWSTPGGGGHVTTNQYPWLWEMAQGTLGVITRLVVKAEYSATQVSKVFVIPFDKLETAIEPLRRIQRKELGLECFLLNDFNLAAIRAEDWAVPGSFPCSKVAPDGFSSLRSRLPKWTLVIHLAGLPYFPEEKVAYEEEALKNMCIEMGLPLAQTVAGEEGLEATLLDLILHPWLALKKANFRGSFHPVSFYTVLRNAPEFEAAIFNLAQEHGYAAGDIGEYLLPIERGRNCYLEFDFHCELDKPESLERVKDLWLKANKLCADRGAVLAKPYGQCADIIYSRVQASYVDLLKKWKKALDPNNIMNPGKLCFQ
jgi:FAD/FMN-containing dehydrogenase